MASASESQTGTGEGSQSDAPFIVLHEARPSDVEPNNSFNDAEYNSTPMSAAPPSPSTTSNVSSTLGSATSESTPVAFTPLSSASRVERGRPERGRVEKGSKTAKSEKRNGLRHPALDDPRGSDVWSYHANSPAGAQSPVQGPAHTRQGSYPEQSYTGPSSHPPMNPYQSPKQYSNQQRPEGEWQPNNWNNQYAPSAVSPSAMTFDGHFPQGPQPQPPFPNGIRPSPEMAHGPSSTSSFSPLFVQTNFPGPNSMHGPPFARVPLSGYELLAAKLSGSLGGPPIKPIYRRFEALNHRLMLHLQDELAELEEQLHSLDAADTQARQHPGGIFPASRRQESPNPNAPSAQRTELLGRIGYKIFQYQKVITSFRGIHELSPPTIPDIHEYRTYLAAGHPVVEEEGRFLDATDDLARLDLARDTQDRLLSETVYTPMPRSTTDEVGFPPNKEKFKPKESRQLGRQDGDNSQQTALAHFMLAIFVAILAPIITFLVIPSFMGRMTVVLLVWSGIATALMQFGVFNLSNGGEGVTECIIATAVYVVAMAIIASAIN